MLNNKMSGLTRSAGEKSKEEKSHVSSEKVSYHSADRGKESDPRYPGPEPIRSAGNPSRGTSGGTPRSAPGSSAGRTTRSPARSTPRSASSRTTRSAPGSSTGRTTRSPACVAIKVSTRAPRNLGLRRRALSRCAGTPITKNAAEPDLAQTASPTRPVCAVERILWLCRSFRREVAHHSAASPIPRKTGAR